MNGSPTNFVVGTNVIFMSIYNPENKAGDVMKFANKNKIRLFSTDSVKEELFRVLKRELSFFDEEIETNIEKLPITWIGKEVYLGALDKTKVKHKADKPIEALALILGCEILSSDKHFKNRADVNKLLSELK